MEVNKMLISHNYTKGRGGLEVQGVTIHHMAGNLSIESCKALFDNPERRASSNYAIGSDGRVALYVDENNTSWCSSSTNNDQKCITIEVANNSGAPGWTVSDAAIKRLVELLVDICNRHGIDALRWRNDRDALIKPGYQNMTLHRWYKDKVCPGPYLEANMGVIARDVNEILGCTPQNTPGLYYCLYVEPTGGVSLEHVMDELRTDAGFQTAEYVTEYGVKKIRLGSFKTISTGTVMSERAKSVCPHLECDIRLKYGLY